MSTDAERKYILQMFASGKITADEGLNLINALMEDEYPPSQDQVESPPTDSQQPGNSTPEAQEPEMIPGPSAAQKAALPPDAQKWRSWWIYPFVVGVIVVILGGWLLYWVQQSYGVGFWFLCSWLPFLLGVALMALSWEGRATHWIHIRVHQKSGEWPRNIAISMPLPLGLASWFFRTFGDKIPGVERASMEELIQSVDRNTSPENPVYIEVEEGEHGEQVEIYIG
jgi:hypothetical protein